MDKETGKRVAGGKPQRQPGEKRPKKPGRLSRQQKVLVSVAAVLAVALVAVLAYQSVFVKPELPTAKDPAGPDGPEAIDYGQGIQPRVGGERKSKDWYTVLILGRDTGGGGNTDTMLLASYDVTNQRATVMSIPRDTMVNVSWDIKRINSVYNMKGGGEKGIQALYQEISQLVGFEPDYQVVVEWEAVGELVDAMGGVWFDVPRDMDYKDPFQDLVIKQAKGYRLLSGDDAMQVIRYRHDTNPKYGYPDGDLGRIKTQQAFLTAMVGQLLKLENITKVDQFAKVFQENVETDLSFQNILWFAKSAYLGGLRMENVNFVTMPNKGAYLWSRSVGNMQSYVTPKASELLDLVNNDLSPFVEKFTLSDLDIMSVNADGSVSSSTGHVEDAKAAVPPVKPSKEPEKPEEPTVDENGNVIDPETGEVLGTLDPATGEVVPLPETGGTTVPPDGGASGGEIVTPPGGTTTPPGGGTTTPPEGGSGGGTAPPPSGGESGGTTTPPSGGETGGTTTPPSGGETGGTTAPPSDGTTGGTTTPPATEPTVPPEPTVPENPDFIIIDPSAPAA